jgi:hypothetical protein
MRELNELKTHTSHGPAKPRPELAKPEVFKGLCIDCSNYMEVGDVCRLTEKRDPVKGGRDYSTCKSARAFGGPCGPSGRNFEPLIYPGQ